MRQSDGALLGGLLATAGKIAGVVALTDGRERGYARGGGVSGAAVVERRTLAGLHDGGAGAGDGVSVGDIMANATGGGQAAVLHALPAGISVSLQRWPPAPAHAGPAPVAARSDMIDAARRVVGPF